MFYIKKLYIFILLLTLLSLSSCVTKALWEDPSYEEMVSQFFVADDGRYVIFIGDKFHYVFTGNTNLLKEVIALKQQAVLSAHADKTRLQLDSDNNITGELVLSGPFSVLPPEDKYHLQALGFKPDKNDEIWITVKMSGRRYAAKYIGIGIPVSNAPYKLKIHYSDPNLIKGLGKAAVTPIAVTLDAVLFVGKVMLHPLGSGD
jgi:hypothetical protein